MARNNQEEEEHEFSEAVEAEIAFFWPLYLTPDDPRFEVEMIQLQLAMLKAHSYLMGPSDKTRALRTAVYLKKKIRGEETTW